MFNFLLFQSFNTASRERVTPSCQGMYLLHLSAIDDIDKLLQGTISFILRVLVLIFASCDEFTENTAESNRYLTVFEVYLLKK